MRSVEARDRLHQWLLKQGIETQAGERHQVKTMEGSECLLWLPEKDTTLFIFIQLAVLTMPQDNCMLTLAMALNLEPVRTSAATIGYNPESRQLMLRSAHPMEGLDEAGLDRIMTQLSRLAGALQRYFEDFRRQEIAGRSVQKVPRALPAPHLGRRAFMI